MLYLKYVTQKAKVVAKVTTDKEGKADISDLSIGKYELVEVETPAGYKPLEKPVSFEITKGMTKVLSLQVENEQLDKGSVEITKWPLKARKSYQELCLRFMMKRKSSSESNNR